METICIYLLHGTIAFLVREGGETPAQSPATEMLAVNPSTETMARIQPAQGWSMGFQRESEHLPLVMGLLGAAGTPILLN